MKWSFPLVNPWVLTWTQTDVSGTQRALDINISASPAAGTEYFVYLTQDGTGSRTVTWPGTVKWPAATAPTLTTTAGKTDVFAFLYDGSNYFGRTVGLNYT
jgi:hypothetical protein